MLKNQKLIDHIITEPSEVINLKEKYDLITSVAGSINYAKPQWIDALIVKYANALTVGGVLFIIFDKKTYNLKKMLGNKFEIFEGKDNTFNDPENIMLIRRKK